MSQPEQARGEHAVMSPRGQRGWRGQRRWRGYALGLGAIAWLVLTEWARDYFIGFLSGVLGFVVLGVLGVLALYWLVSNPPEWWPGFWRWFRRGPGGGGPPSPVPIPADLQSYAEHAEHWLFVVGSEGSGMAAAEWFRREEPALRTLLAESDVQLETVEDLAWICDALETGYVRGRRADDLLAISQRLAEIGEQLGRRDLEELAAVRAATAHRLKENLPEAVNRLGVATKLAPRGKAAAAMRARRELEHGLVHLARADRQLPGDDRTDAILSARDRFDDAGLAVPRADLAADIAIHLNIAVVCLYQHDTDKALDHLRLAAARASAARDASAQAHALELTGVAACVQGNRPQAVRRWQEAQRRYADVDEREGEARCLQHLGSAAFLEGDVAEACELLKRSAQLRGGVDGHEVLEHYLAQACTPEPESPPEPTPRPDQAAPLEILRQQWEKLRQLWRKRKT